MRKNQYLKTLDQFIEEQYGKIGTPKRDKLEKGYEKFKQKFIAKYK
jgi:HTH-type transcriptional regulator/antitoxin HipB